jgi:hypothetical protein
MTDTRTPSDYDTTTPADDSFAWSEPEQQNAKGREWVAQLQTMIENLATQAGPVLKEVGAKAAELAALAGEKAGPVAQKAAELTGQAGQKVAEKGRDLAAELRRDVAASKAGEVGSETAADVAEAASEVTDHEPTTTTVA